MKDSSIHIRRSHSPTSGLSSVSSESIFFVCTQQQGKEHGRDAVESKVDDGILLVSSQEVLEYESELNEVFQRAFEEKRASTGSAMCQDCTSCTSLFVPKSKDSSKGAKGHNRGHYR